MSRRCAQCGDPLYDRRARARYCSGSCRAAASRDRVERTSGSSSLKKPHSNRTSGRWFDLNDPDDLDRFAGAVMRTFPGSTELPQKDDDQASTRSIVNASPSPRAEGGVV